MWAEDIVMIPEFIKEKRPQIARLCRKYGVRKLWLIGSMARGNSTKASDIDFLVDYKPGAPPSRSNYDLKGGLNDALTDLFARKVDLINRRLLRPVWVEYVTNEAEIYYVAARRDTIKGHSGNDRRSVSSPRRRKAKAVSRK